MGRQQLIRKVVSLSFLIATTSFSANCPIIFVHGQRGGDGAMPDEAWKDWDGAKHNMPYRSAMDRILEQHYGDYTVGKLANGDSIDCDMNSVLASTGRDNEKRGRGLTF